MQRELIDKYFRNECSEEERKLVLEYFSNNPGEWDQYVNEEDWDQFESTKELDAGITDRLYKQISDQTTKTRSFRPLYRMAAAAVAALLIGTIWSYMHTGTHVREVVTPPQLAVKNNDSDTIMRIMLDDGSVVLLSPQSTIRYQRRTVTLEGKAEFQVQTDINTPFIVHADRLVTTVLGTSFTIDAFNQSQVVRIKLHTGKVQVAAHDKWILQPGDELTYHKGTMLASINHFTPARKLVKAGGADSKNARVHRPDIYSFDVSPLSDVFDQLSVYYQVDIYYYPADIQSKYFSGKMHNTDQLETILHDIGLLNQLKIEKQEQHYIISRKD